MTAPTTHLDCFERVRAAGVPLHLPEDPAYLAAAAPWNLAARQQPAAVAMPESSAQVAAVVAAAAQAGLRIAPQGTGHGAAPLAAQDLSDTILVRTGALDSVRVDAGAQSVTVGAGAIWQQVVEAAAAHGLAALHGSSPDVGVAGFTLGGGLSWLGRRYGLAANSVLSVEAVTAEGRVVRADHDNESELFWALRGGAGSFAVVTELVLRLYPVSDTYAGMLLWDLGAAPHVVPRWVEWTRTAPEEATTSLRLIRFPPIPELPAFLSGRSVVVIDGAVLGDDAFARSVLGPLRALGPELDTFDRVPAAALSRIHMDPEGPTPAVTDGIMLRGVDERTVQAFLDAAGPGADPGLMVAELRQLGGALDRVPDGAGAVDRLDGELLAHGVAIAPTPEAAAAGLAQVRALMSSLRPWAGRSFLNFSEDGERAASSFDEPTWQRLLDARTHYDPSGVLRAAHPVP